MILFVIFLLYDSNKYLSRLKIFVKIVDTFNSFSINKNYLVLVIYIDPTYGTTIFLAHCQTDFFLPMRQSMFYF